MAILVVFWRFLWAKKAKLSLIDFFKTRLPGNSYANDGENKLEVDI